jgi:hypothetical protein
MLEIHFIRCRFLLITMSDIIAVSVRPPTHIQTLAHSCNTPGRIPSCTRFAPKSRVRSPSLTRLRCRRAAELVLLLVPPSLSHSSHLTSAPATPVHATCGCFASDASNALVDGQSKLGLCCYHILQSSSILKGGFSSFLRGVLSCESTKKSEKRHASLHAASR